MDGGEWLVRKSEIEECLVNSSNFVSEGIEEILRGKISLEHGVSSSPGATALASLALLALGGEFQEAQARGIQWLRKDYRGGWGKVIKAQNEDGGWGSVVETGLALSGLLRYKRIIPLEVIEKGLRNLRDSQNLDGSFRPSYRAIYAKGWNYEEPITTTLTAIRALSRY